MNLLRQDMAQSIYSQLDIAHNAGFNSTTARLPVIDVTPLRIGLASPKKQYDSHEFNIDLSRHPSGLYAVGVESSLGMSMGMPVHFVAGKQETSSSQPSNFESMHLLVGNSRITGTTTDFDGNYQAIVGISTEGQELLVAQLAGLIVSRSLRDAA